MTRRLCGLGSGLDLSQVALVGARDLDPPEQELIATGAPHLIPIGPHMAADIADWVGDSAVFVHFDCDVLDSGLCPSEFQVPAGLSFADLEDIVDGLARKRQVGFEIAEFQSAWPDGRLANAK